MTTKRTAVEITLGGVGLIAAALLMMDGRANGGAGQLLLLSRLLQQLSRLTHLQAAGEAKKD